MLVIPAIDLRGGRCVRLRQGDYEQETVFGDDPVAMAKRWVDDGAKYLHLVDLDGAKEGRPVNTRVIGDIVRLAGVPCQVGGGLRSHEGLQQAFDQGVERAIVGTRAVADPKWFAEMVELFPGKLAIALDARAGKLATQGWLASADWTALEFVQQVAELPLAAIVYTDIARDGMLEGPNFTATEEIVRHSPHPVIAAGGIATAADVLELSRRGLAGCILGRSIYEGTIQLAPLLRALAAQPPIDHQKVNQDHF